MLNPLKALLPAVAALCLSAAAHADGPTWFADFDEASKEAAKTGKDMFVDFTGSDWCIWCKRLHEEVYAFDAFNKGVENDFVLVALDFPHSAEAKAKVPNPARNDALLKEHGIQGFPTILLMTPKGEVYARTGYQKGGPEKYVEQLAELRTKGKHDLEQVGAVVDAYQKAEGEAKLKAWDDLATFAESLDGDSAFAARVAAPLKTAFTVDPKNEQGRKLRAVKALYKLGQADDEVGKQVAELDPTNANGLLEMSVEKQISSVRDDATAKAAIEALSKFDASAKFKDKELAMRLYSTVAMWEANQLENPEAAKPWAKKVLELKPEDPDMVAAMEKIAGT